jgi:hypothetical protein
VKLLRSGGGYLAGRARYYGAQHLWIIMSGLFITIIVGLMWHPVISLVPLLLAVKWARPVQQKLVRFRSGIAGEQDVTALLGRLPDGYVVVNDVVLPGMRGNIDHVVFGPCGIVVIETKRYRGVVACRHGRWSQNGRPIPSVGKQVDHAAVALREFLCREHPELRILRWIDSVVVLTHPLCRLEIDRPGVTMVRFSELLGVILAKGERNRLSAPLVKKLAHTLVRQARVQDLPA